MHCILLFTTASCAPHTETQVWGMKSHSHTQLIEGYVILFLLEIQLFAKIQTSGAHTPGKGPAGIHVCVLKDQCKKLCIVHKPNLCDFNLNVLLVAIHLLITLIALLSNLLPHHSSFQAD